MEHHHHSHHGHKKHGHHPHDHMAATVQFKHGHWEKPCADVDVADTKYSAEFGQGEAYKKDVDALAHYARKHKPKY